MLPQPSIAALNAEKSRIKSGTRAKHVKFGSNKKTKTGYTAPVTLAYEAFYPAGTSTKAIIDANKTSARGGKVHVVKA